jgi:hypothetical protein
MKNETDEAADLVAEDAPVVTEDMLDRIKELATQAKTQEMAVTQLTNALAEAKRLLDKTLTRDLPELMDSAGIPSITVSHLGWTFTVSVKTFYSASIGAKWDEERRKAAFKWLEDHGHGSLIKTEVAVQFPRDDRDMVTPFIGQLDDMGYTYMLKEGVHSGTLTAWLKEMASSGQIPPLDVIGGYIERQATIKDNVP